MAHVIRSTADDTNEALHHIAAGDYAAALALLGRVVAFNPHDERPFGLSLVCHMKLGRYERAVELAEDRIRRGPAPSADLYSTLCSALTQLGRYDDAEKAGRRAMELAPGNFTAVSMLSEVYAASGRRDAAIDLCREESRRHPKSENLHFAYIEAAHNGGRYDIVIEAARDFLRRFPRDADVLSMLGTAYMKTEDFRRAERAFRDATQLEPDGVAHHFNLLTVLSLQRKSNESEAWIARLRQRNPELLDTVVGEFRARAAEMQAEAGRSEAN